MESRLIHDSAPNLYFYTENPLSPSSSPLTPKNLANLICKEPDNYKDKAKPDKLKGELVDEIVEDMPNGIIEQYVKPKKNILKPKKLQFEEDLTGMMQIYLPQIV